MSEQPNAPTPAADPAPTQEPKPAEQTPSSFSQADLDRIVADRLARERSKFAGFDELKEKAARLDQFEESQKSEAQRQADATARAQRDAEQARAEALRYKAAASHGISPDYFDLLGSGDEATVTARAERVGGLLKAQAEIETLRAEVEALRAGRAPVSGRPVTALKPGATPEEANAEQAEWDAYARAMNLPPIKH